MRGLLKWVGGVLTWVRLRWRRVLVVGGLLVGVGFVPFAWVLVSSAPYRYEASEVPEVPVALVLGAGLTGEGEPTPFLAGRLDVAADLYARGKVSVLLVSGDNSRDDYDEPGAMRAYLVGRGVPREAVVADYAGVDTWDSCARARRIFGVEKLTVVTQEFHLPRAVALCRAAGLEAFGVGHDTFGDYTRGTSYGWFRESLASGKAMWDALVAQPDPQFLGPVELGVTAALTR
ncbi:ElyC/SanA/YdcF family protein [Umezawaea sp. Da 62-37]|uniref:SanA/YdcF family protein n=1 Tax=Umezawaea sp. Da 62-37 TaxID=3075927 RepID=UPI0028F747DF|nr:ElyC/SanA/YdcF family protein [Umezawaea sp. Da 62-37]WNV82775.1 ElyC/SanA/YdcF family protein [Umezawaea sp. Da 62-37]